MPGPRVASRPHGPSLPGPSLSHLSRVKGPVVPVSVAATILSRPPHPPCLSCLTTWGPCRPLTLGSSQRRSWSAPSPIAPLSFSQGPEPPASQSHISLPSPLLGLDPPDHSWQTPPASFPALPGAPLTLGLMAAPLWPCGLAPPGNCPDWPGESSPALPAQEEPWRTVKHYQYFSGPDHGVPAEPSGVLGFLDEVNRAQSSMRGTGPMVVHCRCDPRRGRRAGQVQPGAGPRSPPLN